MKYRCLIVDDEPLARKLIASHLAKIENVESAGECADAIEAGNFLRNKRIDLIFLDIQMPEVTGIQFIKTLRHPPAVILTTAFREFAPEAFDLDVVDYLLKPISFARFSLAMNRYFERKATGQPVHLSNEAGNFIYVKAERKTHKVPLAEIVYLESLDEYVKVHFSSGVLITRENISSLEQLLSGKMFVRIHRSFIVNINMVTTISAEGVELAKIRLPFGRAYKKGALAVLAGGKSA